jgi:hypothetical protein
MDVDLDLSTALARRRVLEAVVQAVVEGRCSTNTGKVIGELVSRAADESTTELETLARAQAAEIARLRGGTRA